MFELYYSQLWITNNLVILFDTEQQKTTCQSETSTQQTYLNLVQITMIPYVY